MITVDYLFKLIARRTAERDCWIENAKKLQEQVNKIEKNIECRPVDGCSAHFFVRDEPYCQCGEYRSHGTSFYGGRVEFPMKNPGRGKLKPCRGRNSG